MRVTWIILQQSFSESKEICPTPVRYASTVSLHHRQTYWHKLSLSIQPQPSQQGIWSPWLPECSPMLFFISLTETGPGTLSTAFPKHSALSLTKPSHVTGPAMTSQWRHRHCHNYYIKFAGDCLLLYGIQKNALSKFQPKFSHIQTKFPSSKTKWQAWFFHFTPSISPAKQILLHH